MEGLTRLVSESLARPGFDRPLDYRRLHWSRWVRCESHHSLLIVPSKPGVFAIAEEIMDLNRTAAAPFESGKPEPQPRRMLAVTQFFEDDDMAFVLDRMLSLNSPMRERLESGRYFVRFVEIQDAAQRSSICNALNQWIASATEKSTGIGSHFASSLELTPATEYIPQADPAQQHLFAENTDQAPGSADAHAEHTFRYANANPETHDAAVRSETASGTTYARPGSEPTIPAAPHLTAPQLDSGAATNIHCPSPLPSGF